MSEILRVGDVVRSNHPLKQITYGRDTWESFSPGVMRHRYSNELRGRHDVPREELLVERTYAPEELMGVVENEDFLNPGQFNIRWYENADFDKPVRSMMVCERNHALEEGHRFWAAKEVTVLHSLNTPIDENIGLEAILTKVREI